MIIDMKHLDASACRSNAVRDLKHVFVSLAMMRAGDLTLERIQDHPKFCDHDKFLAQFESRRRFDMEW